MDNPQIEVEYIYNPDLSETFVDSLGSGSIEHNVFKIDLCVTRVTKIDPNNKPTEKQKIPVCRLVLAPEAIVHLCSHLESAIDIMKKSGFIKTVEPPAEGIQ